MINISDKEFENMCNTRLQEFMRDNDYSEEKLGIVFSPLLALATSDRQKMYITNTIDMVVMPVVITS